MVDDSIGILKEDSQIRKNFLYELEKRVGKKIKIGQKICCINPKHEDKEPSMHIYEDHAYCFGCGFTFPPRNNQLITESFQFLLNEYAANVERFHKVQPFFYDLNKIFWIWNLDKNCYEMCDELHLLSLIDKKLEFQGSTIRKNVRNEYLEAFKLIGRRNIPKTPEKTWIQFGNIITNINKGMFDDASFYASPDYFFVNPIPYKIGKSDKTPTLDKLFEDWVGKDYVKSLYEIIAYCCINDYPIHLVFCLVGSGRNGKTQFQKIINKYLGNNNICSTELDLLLENRFESAKLYKKLVCLLGETNFGIMKKTSLLKKLSGGDLIGFEFKNKNPFDENNYAKIIINSNSLPSSLDTSEGFYRRWFIIDFPNNFPEGKDIINSIPEIEYENLSRKLITILKDLLKRGKFTNQGSIEERKNAYIMASNPLPYFIKNFCYKDIHIYIKTNDLYNKYLKFLNVSNKRRVSRKEFHTLLSEEGFYSEKTSRGDESGWFVCGLNLKKDWEKLLISKKSIVNHTKNDINDKNDRVLNLIPYRESKCKNQSQMEFLSFNEYLNNINEKDILFHIENLGKNGKMLIEEVIEHFGKESEEIIENMKNKGLIFEIDGGFVKIL